jgi:redox-sensitive bicupin YhaK (pirin superfamily)
VDIGPTAAATTVAEGTLAVLGEGNRARLRAPEQAAGVLLAAGRPLRGPVVQRGPFVMNTEEEIKRAFADTARAPSIATGDASSVHGARESSLWSLP